MQNGIFCRNNPSTSCPIEYYFIAWETLYYFTTGLAILVPFISEWIKTSKTSNKRGEYPPLVVHYDSLQIRSIVEDILKNKESMMKKEAGKIDTIPK